MVTGLPRSSRRLPNFVRIIRARPRLFVSGLLGAAIVLASPAEWRTTTRLLVGWDVGVALYLALACHLVWRAEIAHIRRRAALQDEGQTALLVLTVASALASLGAIVAELGTTAGTSRTPGQLLLATLTIVLSWIFIHTIFALHYAHEYYDENSGHGGGLKFLRSSPTTGISSTSPWSLA